LYDRFLALLEESGYSFRSVHQLDATSPRDLVLAVAAGYGVMLRPLSLRAVDEAGINVIRCALDPEPTFPDTVIAWCGSLCLIRGSSGSWTCGSSWASC